MGQYVARRLGALVLVWLGISLLAFILGTLAPGDPAPALYQLLYDQPPPNDEAIEAFRREWGLADPLPLRYGRWVLAAARGDLGLSYRTGRPVLWELAQGLRWTFLLALLSLGLAVILALPVGTFCALRANTAGDFAIRALSMLIASMPSYWVAYLLILLFAASLKLLPVAGTGSWRHLVLPVLSLGITGSVPISRAVRSSVLEVLAEDYTRTAVSKGLSRRLVIFRHVLRNALILPLTMMGRHFGALMTGSVVVETVFSRPGLGRVILEAIGFRDYPLIQGFVLLSGTVFVLVNLVVDLSYALIDPRIRLSGQPA